MSAVVLTAMPEDHGTVRNIVGALSESDLDIFWERAEPGSRQWPQAVKRVEQARGAVFFWSAAASKPEAEPYRRLAGRAARAGKAICVRLDGAAIPSQMATCTTYDLRGWRGRASSLFMLDLVAGVKAKAAGLDPPLPRAPRQLLLRRLAVAVPSAVAALALAVGLYRDVGIDRIAGPAEARAWAALRAGSCEDLRGFLRAHSDGVHAAEAQALLDSRSIRSETRWRRAERPLPLYVPSGSETGAPDETAARVDALARGTRAADRNCRGLAEAASARLVSARVRTEGFACDRFSSGIVCALEGEAVCVLDEPEATEIESCGRAG